MVFQEQKNRVISEVLTFLMKCHEHLQSRRLSTNPIFLAEYKPEI
jgi:hypothetical protein